MEGIERHYRISEMSEITGVKVHTLRRWIKRGALKASRPGGKLLLVKMSDFDACMKNETVNGRSLKGATQ